LTIGEESPSGNQARPGAVDLESGPASSKEGKTMAEVVHYEGQLGLMAVLQALENVRHMLGAADITAQDAAGFLGCINLHLAQLIGVQGDFVADLEECGGLLCPNCKAFVGFISNLSAMCPQCGKRILPLVGTHTHQIEPKETE
jgi:hypothetical protein